MLSRVSSAEQQQRTIESWLEELNFYETEIGSCELSLEQFILSLQQDETLAAAERFQNQFIHQREVVNELKFKIRQYLRALQEQASVRLNGSLTRYYQPLSEEVEMFRRLFNELLLEFDDFLKVFA